MTDQTLDTHPTIALLRHRRSVPPPTMAGPGPTPEELDAILSLAARVPDHGKLAPWRFIVFEGDARARAGDAIAAVHAQDNPDAKPARLDLERKRLQHAPTVVAVVSRAAPHAKIPEWEQVLSAGAAAMNLLVAANALGFATAWLTEWYSYDARVAEALGLAPHEKFAGFVHIGRPTTAVEDRVRPVMADIVTRY
jgi:nitroreductase